MRYFVFFFLPARRDRADSQGGVRKEIKKREAENQILLEVQFHLTGKLNFDFDVEQSQGSISSITARFQSDDGTRKLASFGGENAANLALINYSVTLTDLVSVVGDK